MTDLHPPEEHQLLVFWVALLVIVVVARGLGAVARRFGQPAVIGELAAGVVLGPSVLGALAPGAFEWLFPPDDVQTAMLFTVGWLGVVFLLVVTGDETDLGLIRRLGRAAGIVSTGSLVVPLAAGFAVGLAMPTVFLGGDGDRTVFALFLAAALSISSLPVIAKILGDMGFMRRDFGQLTLAAGMANDVIGWVVLGVVAGLAQAGQIDLGAIASTLLGLAVFFLLAFTVGQRALDWSLTRLRLSGAAPGAATGVLIVVALAAGAATQWLGVEAVLGAFVAGVLIGRSRLRDHKIIEPIETATTGLFAPVFFATAGLRVDLGLLTDPEVLLWAVVVLAVASIAKFAGAMIGAKLTGLSGREGAAPGVGLNARGALEIVIATVGISLGVLNQASYTVIVLMAIATSMAAPPMLRRVLRGWDGSPEEQRRLEREEALRSNLLVRDEPVLVPTRGGSNSVMAAQIVALAWPSEVGVTLASASANGRRADTSVLHAVLHDHAVDDHTLPAHFDVDAILTELRLGFGAVVVGCSAPEDGDRPLPPFVEELAARSPVPVVIVRRGLSVTGRQPPAYGRVLLPIAGTASSRAAQELGFNISASIGTRAVLGHVVTDHGAGNGNGNGTGAHTVPENDGTTVGVDVLTRPLVNGSRAGEQLLDQARARARELGARWTVSVRSAPSAAVGILGLAEEHETDLVVVGATRRNVQDHLFLGHTVEQVLRSCDATTIVVVTPGGEDAS